MSEQDMNKIKKLADGHTMTPRPEAWKKLKCSTPTSDGHQKFCGTTRFKCYVKKY